MTGPGQRCHDGHCVTCADEGVPMRVLRVDRERALALCAGPDGARSSVEIALVEPVAPGDALLVHAGTALVSLDAAATAGGPGPAAGAPRDGEAVGA